MWGWVINSLNSCSHSSSAGGVSGKPAIKTKIVIQAMMANVMQIVILAEKLSKFSALPIATKWISPLGVLRQKQ